VDNVDKWTIDFKSLTYNIRCIYTTIYQPLAYMVFNIIHNIHNSYFVRVRALFLIVHNQSTINPQSVHKLKTTTPKIYLR